MDIAKKRAIAHTAIDSIVSHTDQDGKVRQAALVEIKAYCDTCAAQIDAEVAAEIERQVPQS